MSRRTFRSPLARFRFPLLMCLAVGTLAVGPLAIGTTPDAEAGGYDTPILYSARQLGMGGTAQAYVDDPSAIFHNPAGLADVAFAEVMADFSPIVGNIKASPTDTATDIDAETTFAPFFLVGGSIRATDWLVFGLGAYPVASAGAEYRYDNRLGEEIVDSTTLAFIEISPAVAVNLPFGIKLGAGYRITVVTLERKQGDLIEFEASGENFLGFRVGAQFRPIEEFSLGITYRHKTETEVVAEEGIALGMDAEDIKTTFILPSKIKVGARTDVAGFGAALDFEYTFQSQNDRVEFEGTPAGSDTPIVLENIFEWQDAITIRAGVEYDFEVANYILTPRLGYIWDQKVTNRTYPSAFGTPPDDTHTATLGFGFDGGPWEANFAYAFRTGSAEITEDDVPNDTPGTPGFEKDNCVFCGAPGNYELTMHGIYLDFSWEFELGDWQIGVDPWAAPASGADGDMDGDMGGDGEMDETTE